MSGGDKRIARDNLPAIRAMVGLVFQNPDEQLFSPTVFADVAFGPLHMSLPKDEVTAAWSRRYRQCGCLAFVIAGHIT